MDLNVQKIFYYWAFAAISIVQSVVFDKLDNGKKGFTSLFVSAGLKIGSSL